MLSEICAEIKNYFTYESDRHIGDFAITGGVVAPPIDLPTNYIRIVGSRLNDGVHILTDNGWGLVDEDTFHGEIWIMSPPADFLQLVSEIEAWQEKYGGVESANLSPFQSESFGGYSYSKGSSGSNAGAGGSSVPTWQSQYASRLKQYRRIRVI